MEFVNIYQFPFHPLLQYACVYCVRFVIINLRQCGKPWRWLVATSCLPPMLNRVCYVWLCYNWLFVFNCICASHHRHFILPKNKNIIITNTIEKQLACRQKKNIKFMKLAPMLYTLLM